jgi:predicted Zn-dependent protease
MMAPFPDLSVLRMAGLQRLRIVSSLTLGLLLAGCANDGNVPLVDASITAPPTPPALEQPRRVDPRPLPSDAPRGLGIETRAAAEFRKLTAAFGGEYRNPAVKSLLEPVLARVVASGDDPALNIRLTLLNSSAINAFALPGGDIFVSRGLLALASDTSELAAVLAHEVAHVTAKHAFARAALERRSQIVSRVAVEVLNDREAGQLVRDQGRIEIAGFSRAQELEADLIGVRTAHAAGFDPYGAQRFLTALGRLTAIREGLSGGDANRPDIFATHPSTPERIRTALSAARQLAEPGSAAGESGRDAYLAAIDGMTFGEDAQSGLVDGPRFIHPRLRFAFDAPDGFRLDLSAQSVVGVARNATEALRFDGVKLEDSDTLESYLARGLIEDVPTTEIETFTANGVPAATGIARGKDWTFRFGVYSVGGNVYRLILAAQSYDAATEARFQQAIRSFRPITQGEAAAFRSQRLRIITAKAGDTVASLARGLPGGEIAFRSLNNLGAGEQPEAGKRYKTIAR